MIFQGASFIYAKFPQARHPGTLFKKKAHRSPQVGVECHALVFVVAPPILVVAIEFVFEEDPFRRDETVGRIVDFQHAGVARRQMQIRVSDFGFWIPVHGAISINHLIVCDHLLDDQCLTGIPVSVLVANVKIWADKLGLGDLVRQRFA